MELCMTPAIQRASHSRFSLALPTAVSILLWANGSTIKRKQAKSSLGFVYFEVYASSLKINARRVEKALQERYQHLKLGQRLWRCPDMGPKYNKEVDVMAFVVVASH